MSPERFALPSRETRRMQVLMAAALVCTAVSLSAPLTAVRTLFAIPLCLLFPGYALTRAMFRNELSGLQTAMLTLALSFATLVVGALVLDLLPGGLVPGTWAALLLVVILSAAAVAVRRRPTLPARARPVVRIGRAEVGILAVALALAGGAFALSRIPFGTPHAVGYTELWMFSQGSDVSPAVRIGVNSAEKRKTAYRLLIQQGNTPAYVVASHLVLAPGATARFQVPLKLSVPITALVTAELFRGASRTPYRESTALIVPPLSGLRGVNLLSPQFP